MKNNDEHLVMNVDEWTYTSFFGEWKGVLSATTFSSTIGYSSNMRERERCLFKWLDVFVEVTKNYHICDYLQSKVIDQSNSSASYNPLLID